LTKVPTNKRASKALHFVLNFSVSELKAALQKCYVVHLKPLVANYYRKAQLNVAIVLRQSKSLRTLVIQETRRSSLKRLINFEMNAKVCDFIWAGETLKR